jgi:hypothetical protein
MNGYSFIQKGQQTHPLILGREDSAFPLGFNRRFSTGFAGRQESLSLKPSEFYEEVA